MSSASKRIRTIWANAKSCSLAIVTSAIRILRDEWRNCSASAASFRQRQFEYHSDDANGELLQLDARYHPDRQGPRPGATTGPLRQPSRPGGRCDRNREDRDPDGAG